MSAGSIVRRCFADIVRRMFSPITLIVWGVSIIVAVVAGPFGTLSAMDLPMRALFWTIIVSVAVLVGFLVRALAMALVGPERPGMFDTVCILIMTLVFTPVVWLVGAWFARMLGGEAPGIGQMLLFVLVIVAAVVVIRRITPGIEPRNYGFLTEAATPRPDQPRLTRRLDAEFAGEVIRLSGSGHYVEVVTCKGVHTLRLRLRDAIHEMEPIEGFSVHRSHWVAKHAIDGVERGDGSKMFVVLTNGDRVPVSRKYRANLEKAGRL